MGLIALVLAAVIVVAAVAIRWTLHRRASDEAATSPRTVADLVRLRAAQAAPEAPAADDQPAAPEAAGVETPAEASAPEPVVAGPVVARPVMVAAAPAAPDQPPTPTGSDTPWGRAARMTEGDGAVWATGEPDHEWSEWADWADVDETASGVPARPVVLPAVDAPTEEDPLRRRTPAEIAAEQAAADLALLRTFGCAPAASVLGDDDEDELPLAPAVAPVTHPPIAGAAQLVAFHVVGRDGAGIEGAGVTLLDDHGRETTGAEADAKGRGEVRAPHPGSYVLVSAAPGRQPGAVAITVADRPVEAEVLLTRSASVAGTVSGADGPIVGARLTLVQDGEIVDTTGTGPAGEYWIADLAAGGYGLSVTAAECEPMAVLLTVPDETDLRHDVELVPAGLPAAPAAGSEDDVMIGQL